MKILITGATGLLGSRFYHIFNKQHDVVGTYFSKPKKGFQYLDLLDKRYLNNLIEETNPEIIIHTAGIANPDICQEKPLEAYQTNISGTKNLVDTCKKNNKLLIFISSSHVYSEGNPSEKDESNPINYYGQTKKEAEDYIIQNLENYIILRPTKIYGFIEEGKDFTKKIINELKNKDEIFLDHSNSYYPVITDEIVELTKHLISTNAKGIYNISSNQAITKYEWANIIAKEFNLDHNKIKPILENTLAKRPKDLCLNTEKIQNFNFNIIPVQEGVKHLSKQIGCTFDLVYSFRPFKLIKGKSASMIRVNFGKSLAEEDNLTNSQIDMVVPVPESGIYSAQGYADITKIPLYHSIILDYQTPKTLYEPNVGERARLIEQKLIVIPDLIKNKNIVLIDEAILSGVTLKHVITKLKKEGVNEIHVRIPAPLMFSNCQHNILSKDAQLLAKEYQLENQSDIENKLAKYFNVNSIKFLSLNKFKETIPNKDKACFDCFLKQNKL